MRTDNRYEQYTKNQQMRETIFREYPEIQKLDLAKNKWMCFLMSFMLIARIINIILLVQNGNSNLFLLIGANCIGYFTYFFYPVFLYAGQSPKCILFVYTAFQFIEYAFQASSKFYFIEYADRSTSISFSKRSTGCYIGYSAVYRICASCRRYYMADNYPQKPQACETI